MPGLWIISRMVTADCAFSERVSSARKNLKPLVQVSKRVRFGSESGADCRKTGYRTRASLRGFDSIMFE
jgi:hypothetical protein